MKRHDDLKQLNAHIWSELEQGTQPDHPYHTPVFATVSVNNDSPSVRTVILRSVEQEARMLIFHSDRRAQKIGEIRNCNQISWLFWHPETKEQVRLRGTAKLHFDDDLANQIWHESRPQSLKLYVKPIEPGTEVDAPDSGLTEEIATAELESHKQVAAGKKYFVVVSTTIDDIDFLHLHREGNYRAKFKWDGRKFQAAWIIP